LHLSFFTPLRFFGAWLRLWFCRFSRVWAAPNKHKKTTGGVGADGWFLAKGYTFAVLANLNPRCSRYG